MYAKKSLGQNFLKSEKALASIVAAGELNPSDTVLEIGPGMGALTKKLLETGAKVVSVEKDDTLHEFLEKEFHNEISSGQLILVHGDILDFDAAEIGAGEWKLIANIPYNITGAIFKKFLSGKSQPKKIVLLVQKEVAERIVARDGKESVLSISVKAYGEPRLVEKVPAGAFAPAPKVDSAIIAIGDISKKFFSGFEEENFFRILRAGFSSKRKKLSSNLTNAFPKEKILEAFERLGIEENARAEDLSVEMWREIASKLL